MGAKCLSLLVFLGTSLLLPQLLLAAMTRYYTFNVCTLLPVQSQLLKQTKHICMQFQVAYACHVPVIVERMCVFVPRDIVFCGFAGDDEEGDTVVQHPGHPDGERQVPRPENSHQGRRPRRRQGG